MVSMCYRLLSALLNFWFGICCHSNKLVTMVAASCVEEVCLSSLATGACMSSLGMELVA